MPEFPICRIGQRHVGVRGQRRENACSGPQMRRLAPRARADAIANRPTAAGANATGETSSGVYGGRRTDPVRSEGTERAMPERVLSTGRLQRPRRYRPARIPYSPPCINKQRAARAIRSKLMHRTRHGGNAASRALPRIASEAARQNFSVAALNAAQPGAKGRCA